MHDAMSLLRPRESPQARPKLINLSIFYLQAKPERDHSIALATEALECLQDFQDVPAFERYIMTAR